MLKGLFEKIGSVFNGRKINDELLDELEEQLITSDVSLDTTQFLIQGLRESVRRGQVPDDDAAIALLQEQVATLLGEPSPLQFAPTGLTVWLFVGVNGAGKTTTVGKVAARLKARGHRPLLAAADTFRAAAVEQLQEWGRRVDCPVVAQQHGADPAAVVFDALDAARGRACDIVLVDTAGRLHNKSNLMNELAKIGRVIERELGCPSQETLLVVDASTGQNGLVQARSFAGSVPLSGLVLTKWDGTARGGIVLTVAHETAVPVKLVGVGEKIDDLLDFSPSEFARELFASGL